MTTAELLETTLSELATLGWTCDVTSDEPDVKRWELRSPNSNMVDIALCRIPDYEGDFLGVRVSYLGIEYMETHAELADGAFTSAELLMAIHGAALKDAELGAAGK